MNIGRYEKQIEEKLLDKQPDRRRNRDSRGAQFTTPLSHPQHTLMFKHNEQRRRLMLRGVAAERLECCPTKKSKLWMMVGVMISS